MVASSLFTHLGLRAGEMARFPPRVARLVAAEEERSERAISWVQLCVTLTFALLYGLAPVPSTRRC